MAAARAHHNGGSATDYRKANLSHWEPALVPISQPGPPGRDKRGDPFIPGQVRHPGPNQRGCQGRCGRHPVCFRLVLPTGTKWPRFFIFSISFGLFIFHFNCTFVLEFKWSMNSTNIYVYRYSCMWYLPIIFIISIYDKYYGQISHTWISM